MNALKIQFQDAAECALAIGFDGEFVTCPYVKFHALVPYHDLLVQTTRIVECAVLLIDVTGN